jgi:hypothetical protein
VKKAIHDQIDLIQLDEKAPAAVAGGAEGLSEILLFVCTGEPVPPRNPSMLYPIPALWRTPIGTEKAALPAMQPRCAGVARRT